MGVAGSYLVRESERKPGSYVLCYLGHTGINHFRYAILNDDYFEFCPLSWKLSICRSMYYFFRITAVCGDYYIGGRQFDSLSDLIGYYTSWSDLLKKERLIYPVPPPEVHTWNLDLTSFKHFQVCCVKIHLILLFFNSLLMIRKKSSLFFRILKCQIQMSWGKYMSIYNFFYGPTWWPNSLSPQLQGSTHPCRVCQIEWPSAQSDRWIEQLPNRVI